MNMINIWERLKVIVALSLVILVLALIFIGSSKATVISSVEHIISGILNWNDVEGNKLGCSAVGSDELVEKKYISTALIDNRFRGMFKINSTEKQECLLTVALESEVECLDVSKSFNGIAKCEQENMKITFQLPKEN